MSGKDRVLAEERNQSIKQVIRTAQGKYIQGNTWAFVQREPEVAIFKMVQNSELRLMSYGDVVLGRALLLSWMLVCEKRRCGNPRGLCNYFYVSTLGNWVLRYLSNTILDQTPSLFVEVFLDENWKLVSPLPCGWPSSIWLKSK